MTRRPWVPVAIIEVFWGGAPEGLLAFLRWRRGIDPTWRRLT